MIIVRMIGWFLALVAVLIFIFADSWGEFQLAVSGNKGIFKQLLVALIIGVISLGILYFSGAI